MIFIYSLLFILFILGVIFWHSGYQISPEDELEIKKIISQEPIEHVFGLTGDVLVDDNINIHYNHIKTQADKRGTVLLVNGLAQTMLDWPTFMLDGITEAGFDIIRMDNRDVGNSTWVKDWGKGKYYTLSHMAADAIAILDHLQIEQAHVIGVSMGGMITQTLALEYPDRFLSISSLLSTGHFYDRELTQVTPSFRTEVTRIILRYSMIPSTVNSMKAQLSVFHLLHGDGSYQVNRSSVMNRAYYEVKKRKGYNRKASQHHGVAIAKSGSRYDQLSQINIPALILHGTGDPLILVEHAHKYHQMIPNATKCIIDGMGHDLPEKYQKEIMGAILHNLQKGLQS